jgi:repressor LexA
METMTRRQMDVLRYVRDFRKSRGYSPTFQEIGNHLSLTKVTVFEHVGALQKKGLLRRGSKHRARSLTVSPEYRFPDEEAGHIPLSGRIAAGRPIEAVETREELDLEHLFEPSPDTFALRVQGSSMIDEQIRDGDYVICKRGTSVRNGQTVVALLEGGEATLKKVYKEAGRIRLQPANPDFQPIYVREVDVQGVVIGVVRKV